MEQKDRETAITGLSDRSLCRTKTRKEYRDWLDALEEVKRTHTEA